MLEVSLVLIILALGMLSIERWQQRTLLQMHWLNQQLASWILAAQIIDKLANDEVVKRENSAGFRIDYTIQQQLGCRLIRLQVEGRQHSKAQLRLFDCPTKLQKLIPTAKRETDILTAKLAN